MPRGSLAEVSPSFPHRPRLSDIDALRGIAVAMVVISHIPGCLLSPPPEWMLPPSRGLTVGVEIFFVISGFVIGRSLHPEMMRGASIGQHWLTIRRFWLRRARRLLPAAYLWLAISCTASLIFTTGLFDSPISTLYAGIAALIDLENVLLAFRVQHNLAPGPLFHYWSLSLEEEFYFILPFFLLLPRRFLVVSLLIAIPVISWTNGYYAAAFRCEELLSGLVLSVFPGDSRRCQHIEHAAIGLRPLLPALSIALLFAVAQLAAFSELASFGRPVQFWLARLGIAAGSTLLVWLASRDDGLLVGRGRVYHLLLGLGRRSYSIYLAHICAFFGAHEIIVRLQGRDMANGFVEALAFLIGFALLVFFSETTYRIIELQGWRKPGVPIGQPDVLAQPVK